MLQRKNCIFNVVSRISCQEICTSAVININLLLMDEIWNIFLAHFPGKTWISQFLHDFLCPLVSKKEPFATIGTVYFSHHPTKTFRTLKRIRSNHPLASSVLDPPP